MKNTNLTPIKTLSNFFQSDKVKDKFSEVLGSNASGFVTSIISVVNGSTQLQNATQESIYGAALIAASMKLPINPSLGLAYIVPYAQKQADGSYRQVAQFQISYKGLHQLALRSNEYRTIHCTDVRQGELIDNNRLTGEISFSWNQDEEKRNKLPIVGFVSYFKLIGGYESTFYMTISEIQGHAKKYSKNFAKSGRGLWKDEFNLMAMKTVSKLHLNRKGVLSIEMERAIKFDGSAVRNVNIEDSATNEIKNLDASYIDNVDYEEVEENSHNFDDFDYEKALNEKISEEQERDNNSDEMARVMRKAESVIAKKSNEQKL